MHEWWSEDSTVESNLSYLYMDSGDRSQDARLVCLVPSLTCHLVSTKELILKSKHT